MSYDAGQAAGILVLGMHRSGTSALTRTLNLHGAALPPQLMPPIAGNNPTGFWESRPLVHLHDELLRALHTRWDAPGRPWLASPDFERAAWVDRLRAFVVATFPERPLFVVKDPRISLFTDVWIEALVAADIRPACAIAVRDPAEVASSLRHRDGFPRARGVLLWLLYNLSAERTSRGATRCFVRFDHLLGDWKQALARMERQLGIAWPRSGPALDREVEAFLDPTRPGARPRTGAQASRAPVHPWLARMEIALRLLEQDPDCARAMDMLDEVDAELTRAEEIYEPLLPLLEADRGSAVARAESPLPRATIAVDPAVEVARIFDGAEYLRRYPDIAEAGLDPLAHYLRDGWREGRDPHPLFSTTWYLTTYRDVADAGAEPLSHYLRLGWRRSRWPHPLFDGDFYAGFYRDVIPSDRNPLEHYVNLGLAEGRQPHALLVPAWIAQQRLYLEHARGRAPLEWYLAEGEARGASPSPEFCARSYVERYPDTASCPWGALAHYLHWGRAEGRDRPRVRLEIHAAQIG